MIKNSRLTQDYSLSLEIGTNRIWTHLQSDGLQLTAGKRAPIEATLLALQWTRPVESAVELGHPTKMLGYLCRNF